MCRNTACDKPVRKQPGPSRGAPRSSLIRRATGTRSITTVRPGQLTDLRSERESSASKAIGSCRSCRRARQNAYLDPAVRKRRACRQATVHWADYPHVPFLLGQTGASFTWGKASADEGEVRRAATCPWGTSAPGAPPSKFVSARHGPPIGGVGHHLASAKGPQAAVVSPRTFVGGRIRTYKFQRRGW